MIGIHAFLNHARWTWRLLLLGLSVISLTRTFMTANAQEGPEGQIQVLEGYAETSEGALYKLPGLQTVRSLVPCTNTRAGGSSCSIPGHIQ